LNNNLKFGFHRLAIVDPSATANQPFYYSDNVSICNGEIFNHSILENKYEFKMETKSDCEVLLHMYNKFGIDALVNELDAEFAFVIYDKKNNYLYAGRDPYGVRPLFIGKGYNTIAFCSEAKGLTDFDNLIVEPFLPGHYMQVNLDTLELKYTNYYNIDIIERIDANRNNILYLINKLFTESVVKRLMSDQSIGCLLSGGLDSSLVTSIVSRYIKDIQCFSIGLENSVDVIAAKKVSKYLGIPYENHHIITFTVEEGLQALEDVIYHLESYDITTIRASTPQYLLAKYIKTKTNVKVLFSGEGADELFAGYQYSKDAPNAEELHKDTKRLLKELYMYDNLRTDRTISGWGLEVRVPFLDKEFTKFVLSLDPNLRKPSKDIMEKILLRDSFNDNYLPDEILYRPKEAFSDAVSSKEISWYRSLCKYIDGFVTDDELKDASNKYPFNTPQTKEALYYRNIFSRLYPNRDKLIAHYWMPMWQGDIKDPSATVLACHKGDLELTEKISSV
jgi:asparagine synthase (glutamine-hydrolysing)